MADPFGTNITDRASKIADQSDPNLANTKMAQRVRQLRTDVDAVNADAASTTAVLAALAAADGAVAINSQAITGASAVTATGAMTAGSFTGPASANTEIAAATGRKVQIESDDAVEILSDGQECIKAMGIGGASAVGFNGVNPVIIAVDLTGGAFTSAGGTASGANAIVANASQGAIDNNTATLVIALNEIRACLRNLGLMA